MAERVEDLHPLQQETAVPGARVQHRQTKRCGTIVQQDWPSVWVVFDADGPPRQRPRQRRIVVRQFYLLTAAEA